MNKKFLNDVPVSALYTNVQTTRAEGDQNSLFRAH